MKPLARWTIGPVTKAGFKCLETSIQSFTSLYDVDVAICFNCDQKITNISAAILYDQRPHLEDPIKPMGVAWKLYPLRLDQSRHEISIDNDIIITRRIPEIDHFFDSDCTLLLEDLTRTYGRFEKHVPAGFCINSGVYGMPPGFSLERHFNFYCRGPWEQNACGIHAASKTFDEQGLIALALLSHERYTIIPRTVITNCEWQLVEGAGYHFIGLNRRPYHEPYQLFKSLNSKIYL